MARILLLNIEDAHGYNIPHANNFGAKYLWQLNTDDICITHYALDKELVEHIQNTNKSNFKVVQLKHQGYLLNSILADSKLLTKLKKTVADGKWIIDSYMQTPKVIALAEKLKVPMLGTKPELVNQGLIEQINSKVKFKTFCEALNIKTPDYYIAASAAETKQYIDQIDTTKVVLKKEKSAGGRGILTDTKKNLLAAITNWFSPANTIVIEEFLDLKLILGSLVEISDCGLNFIGIDKQIIENNLWCGMEYPYHGTKKHLTAIKAISLKLAQLFYDMGARGWANFDFAITKANKLYALEVNFRHNGMSSMLPFFKHKHIRFYNGYKHNEMILKKITTKLSNNEILISFTDKTYSAVDF